MSRSLHLARDFYYMLPPIVSIIIMLSTPRTILNTLQTIIIDNGTMNVNEGCCCPWGGWWCVPTPNKPPSNLLNISVQYSLHSATVWLSVCPTLYVSFRVLLHLSMLARGQWNYLIDTHRALRDMHHGNIK